MSMNYRNVRLRVGHLYPSLLNVAGDGGNLMAIERRCAWRGLAVDVVPINPGERPDFTSFDLILFHGGQDTNAPIAMVRRAAAHLPTARLVTYESDALLSTLCNHMDEITQALRGQPAEA